jgi:hypothetical protein
VVDAEKVDVDKDDQPPTTGASPVAMERTLCEIVVRNNGMASIPLFHVFSFV